ncbi:MAG: flagellin [Lysobacterales bacterium CG17_big_fil_post_rev_8_21_14_2_50_64_11]|nr:MAG: flagellin [Xanthomonadales bacterium CG17_big_fil_post_rev_8_21_14_2_50_64_11]
MQVINTNIASLNAQRNLSTSGNALSTALERLSSGLRINSAKDDAAGLAIATRFTTQINGLNQAVRNANDGVSLSQTAESALQEVTNNLQRIRELGVQSANATNSASDRAALDQEVQQRIAEIDRIASQTSFNGAKVLDGTFGNAAFQVGANVGETINVNLSTGVRSGQIGQIATSTGSAVTANALGAGGVSIAIGTGSAVSVGASSAGSAPGQTADSAFAKAAAINGASVAGLTTTATTSVSGAFATTSTGAGQTYSLDINGVAVFSGFDLSAGTLAGGAVATQVNLFSTQTGVSASFDSGTGDITFTAADGRNVVAQETLVGGATGGIADAVASAAGVTNRGTLSVSASENIVITGAFADLGLASTITKDSSTLNQVSVTTVANANDAINRVDAALSSVSSLRSTLGAIQNRFESTISNLQAVSQNLSASRSRIQDTDFAAETAALSRAQILQTAGITVLSQANASPQAVLQLLR